MIALIDYDNLDVLARRRGVRHVLTHLIGALGTERIAAAHKVVCRLYGGWFDETALSRGAQRLVPDLRQEFPRRVNVTDMEGSHTVLVHAELASSLVCDPRVVLTHTYRRRSLPPRLQCAAAPFTDCADQSHCPIAGLDQFIRDAKCPLDRCAVAPRAVLAREEQKLVDSMLVIDLVHLAQTTEEPLVVVSADEDLWPGIRFVLLRGAHVIHMVPRRGRAAPNRYRQLETATYSQVVI